MQCKEYLQKMKNIQNSILQFIENDRKIEENFQNITKLIKDNNIQNNCSEFRAFLHLIHNISSNHNRAKIFFKKIEKILLIFSKDFKKYLSNSELFLIFKNNKRILLFLFKSDLLNFDDYIKNYIQAYSFERYPEYFKIKKENSTRREENEFVYCKYIRNDMIDDFIKYANKTELSLDSKIPSSIFETNPLLYSKKTSLIEYAAFYGSVQIFNYLHQKDVKLQPSLWVYSIHSFNTNIIFILEKNNIKPNVTNCLIEAIKCHHNHLVNYIKTHYGYMQENIDDFICQKSIQYYNYSLLYDSYIHNCNMLSQINFFNFCRFDHFFLVKQNLANKKTDINIEINETIVHSFILTPLLIAVRNDNKNIVDVLLKNPVIDVNFKYTMRKWNKFIENGSALYLSLKNDNIEIFKLLLKHQKIDVNSFRYYKTYDDFNKYKYEEYSPLIDSIIKNNTKFVKALISHQNIDVNLAKTITIFNNDDINIIEKTNAIYEAIKIGNIEIVKLLLQHQKIDVNMTSFSKDTKVTPLNYAINKNNLEIVELLLMHPNIDVNMIIRTKTENCEYNNTPLSLAINNNNNEIVKILLQHQKIDVNVKLYRKDDSGEFNESAIFLAISKKNFEIVCFLLSDSKIDINIKGTHTVDNSIFKNECNPLAHAIHMNCIDIIQLLLSHPNIDINMASIKYNNGTEETALNYAIKKNNKDIVNLLLSHPNIDVNNYFESNNTALFAAIENNNNDIVKLLLSKPNIDVNLLLIKNRKFNEYCESALIFAIRNNNFEIVRTLLSHKNINVNIRGNYTISTAINKWNPLTCAVYYDCLKIVQILLLCPNIDVNDCFIIDDKIEIFKKSALSLAIENNEDKIVSLLLRHPNIDVNFKQFYNTKKKFIIKEIPILHIAIANKNIDIIKLLLSNPKIDVNARSFIQKETNNSTEKIKRTALEIAVNTKNIDILNLLLSNPNINPNIKSTRSLLKKDSFFIERKTPIQFAFANGSTQLFNSLFDFLNKTGKLVNENLSELMNMTKDDKQKSIIYNYIRKRENSIIYD